MAISRGATGDDGGAEDEDEDEEDDGLTAEMRAAREAMAREGMVLYESIERKRREEEQAAAAAAAARQAAEDAAAQQEEAAAAERQRLLALGPIVPKPELREELELVRTMLLRVRTMPREL